MFWLNILIWDAEPGGGRRLTGPGLLLSGNTDGLPGPPDIRRRGKPPSLSKRGPSVKSNPPSFKREEFRVVWDLSVFPKFKPIKKYV